jgi:flagellar motor protein MotB
MVAPVDTVAVRLSKYQRRLRLQTAVAAALIAEVTTFSAVKFSESALSRSWWGTVFGAVFLSTILVAGLLLALARGRIEWQADLLTRYLARNEGGTFSDNGAPLNLDMSIGTAASEVPGLSAETPTPGTIFYGLSLVATFVAGGLLATYMWLPLFVGPEKIQDRTKVVLVGLPVSVYFESNQAVVPVSAHAMLGALARSVAPIPTVSLLVEGHADSDYGSEYNLELSRRRAEAVKELLVASGLDAQRIVIAAYGETRPRAPEGLLSGKAQNRRVDISVMQSRPGAPEIHRAPE